MRGEKTNMQYQSKPETQKRTLTLLSDLGLLSVSAIWGATFVTMKNLLANFHVAEILFGRFLVATLFTLLLFSKSKFELKSFQRGLLPGVFLFAGYFFQSWGLVFTTPARSGFITGLSVILVPFISWIILKSKPSLHVYLGVVLSTLGLFLILTPQELATNQSESWLRGDILTLLGASAYALQIVLVEKFASKANGLSMAFGEFSIVTVLSLSILSNTTTGSITTIFLAQPLAVIFLGIVATAMAFIVQKIAQKHTPSTHVALIFASEPVFAALFASLLWGEKFTPRTIAGCVLILGGILSCEMSRTFIHRFQSLQPSGQTQALQRKGDL
jgi:drug/metabolite transporter (DMT)-like permease